MKNGIIKLSEKGYNCECSEDGKHGVHFSPSKNGLWFSHQSIEETIENVKTLLADNEGIAWEYMEEEFDKIVGKFR